MTPANKATLSVVSAAAAALLCLTTAAPGAFASVTAPSGGSQVGSPNSAPVIFNASSGACTTANGSRSLALTDASGNPLGPSNGLNASNTPAPFDTAVADSTYCDDEFEVATSMSNLYSFTPSAPGSTTGTFNCNSFIPSTAVTLAQPTNPLTLGNIVTSLGQPQFALTFNPSAPSLSGVTAALLDPVLALLGLATTGTQTGTNPVAGTLPTDPLTQNQLVSALPSGIFNLTSGLAAAASDLPIQLTGIGTGAFSTADTGPGSCNTTVTGASGIPVLNGGNATTGLLGAVTSVVDGVTGGTGASSPGAGLSGLGIGTTTILGDLLSPTGLLAIANPLLGGLSVLLTPTGLSLTQLETDLVGAVTATLQTTTAGLTSLVSPLTESGNYSADSSLTVNTSAAPAVGSYQGVLYLTLFNT